MRRAGGENFSQRKARFIKVRGMIGLGVAWRVGGRQGQEREEDVVMAGFLLDCTGTLFIIAGVAIGYYSVLGSITPGCKARCKVNALVICRDDEDGTHKV